MATLKDIARETGLSISTISRVINDPTSTRASEESKRKIWKAVRMLGYVPNASARQLRLGEGTEQVPAAGNKILACLTTRPFASTDPFFNEITQAVSSAAIQRGYVLKYLISSYNMDPREILKSLTDDHIAGIIILGKAKTELLVYLHQHFNVTIYCSLNPKENFRYNQVVCDGFSASKAAVQYLIDRGHKKIGYVGELVDEVRYKGYHSALKENGLEFSWKHIIESELGMDSACNRVKKKLQLDDLPTALFCANDATAIGTMKALKEMNLSVPQDISVIGIDDIEMSRYVSPMLTTVYIPKTDLGTVSAQMLIDLIEEHYSSVMKIELPYTIIERQTVRRIRP